MKERLKELVRHEAYALKFFASKEELNKLDFSKLNPNHENNCIYGQMTGCCWSDRAISLLNDCTEPYSYSLNEYFYPSKNKFTYGSLFKDRAGVNFSPIEFYIFRPESNNETLIKFLKGEIEELTIDML